MSIEHWALGIDSMSRPEDITRRQYNSAMSRAPSPVSDAITALVEGRGDDPFAVLGRHEITVQGRPALVFRTMQPGAAGVDLLLRDQVHPMSRVQDGLFEYRGSAR
jgi:hypothetical protein